MNRDAGTIVAISTAPGRSAIAIVRVSGDGTGRLAARVVPDFSLKPQHASLAAVRDHDGRLIDRAVCIFGRGPHTYTGEDTLELHVHGSPIVARDTVAALLAAGARLAAPGEFTQRAFFNGKIDLNEAASVADLIDAESSSAARAAAANLGGGLARAVRAIREALGERLEDLAGSLDFPEEVPEPDRAPFVRALRSICERLQQLRRDSEIGMLLRDGISIAIVGPPNAGKSSLLNALLGEDRAIVSEVPGTTRDTIEESLTIDGVRIRVVDTAGIRRGAGRLESLGIERTQRALERAGVVLIVFDGSAPDEGGVSHLLASTAHRNRVVFFNKADLGTPGAECAGAPPGAILGSVRWERTLDEVRRAIARAGWGGERLDVERPHLATLRELDAAREALDALADAMAVVESHEPLDFCVGDLQRAFAALGHISGDAAAEEIVTGVFARFCIGK